MYQMDPLTHDQVAKLAKLARLSPSDDQVERYRHDLASILQYVERLNALNLDGVTPLFSPLDQDGPLGEDVAGPGLPTATLMAMAPDRIEPFVKVPEVIGEGA